MATDLTNNYFNGNGNSLDMDALFQIFGVKKYKNTDPVAPTYGPGTGTPGPQVDFTSMLGSVAPMAGAVPPVNYTSQMAPAGGAFWLQDIVNRAHNTTRTDPVQASAAKKSSGGK